MKIEKKDYSLCIIHVDVLVRDELGLAVCHKRFYTKKTQVKLNKGDIHSVTEKGTEIFLYSPYK